MDWIIFSTTSLLSVLVISAEGIKELFKEKLPCLNVAHPVQCEGPVYDPFTGRLGADGNKVSTKYFLFTAKIPDRPEPLHVCGGKLPLNTNYNKNFKTVIIIHGYHDGVCESYWMREMKNKLFFRGNYNVILVDWSWDNGNNKLFSGTKQILQRYKNGEFKIFLKGRLDTKEQERILENDDNRTQSALNTIIVGEQVAFVIENILRQKDTNLDQFHIIGHSMGCHIAGTAGNLLNGLRRITGMDPSLTPFESFPDKYKLDHTDAKLVDVIHGNSGNSSDYAIGNIAQLGHADFYPNGGVIQLSCVPFTLQSFLNLDFAYALSNLDAMACSHMQVIQYYLQSINNTSCQFVGVASRSYEEFQSNKCCCICNPDDNKCAVMGMDFETFWNPNDTTRRKYYLNTQLLSPYIDNSGINLTNYPVNDCKMTPKNENIILELYKRLFESSNAVLMHA